MNWNITNVEKENNNDYDVINIIGFSPDYNNKCFHSSITKTTLKQALNIKEKLNISYYHEGYGLSIVNENLVYIIEVRFNEEEDTYKYLKNLSFINIIV